MERPSYQLPVMRWHFIWLGLEGGFVVFFQQKGESKGRIEVHKERKK